MVDLLIRRVNVLQVRDEKADVLAEHDIAVKGNRIEAIAPSGGIDPSHARTVIDADGQLAMPGFINTHAHVAMVLWRGMGEDVNIESWFNDYIWHLEANLEPEDVYWGMQLGLLEMIEAGITSVNDHYWHMDYAARAVEKAGTRALLGQAMFGANGMGQIEETSAFVKRWDGQAGGRIRTILAPHAPYTCDDDFLRASARKAEQISSGIHIHVAETLEQTSASLARRGQTRLKCCMNAASSRYRRCWRMPWARHRGILRFWRICGRRSASRIVPKLMPSWRWVTTTWSSAGAWASPSAWAVMARSAITRLIFGRRCA